MAPETRSRAVTRPKVPVSASPLVQRIASELKAERERKKATKAARATPALASTRASSSAPVSFPAAASSQKVKRAMIDDGEEEAETQPVKKKMKMKMDRVITEKRKREEDDEVAIAAEKKAEAIPVQTIATARPVKKVRAAKVPETIATPATEAIAVEHEEEIRPVKKHKVIATTVNEKRKRSDDRDSLPAKEETDHLPTRHVKKARSAKVNKKDISEKSKATSKTSAHAPIAQLVQETNNEPAQFSLDSITRFPIDLLFAKGLHSLKFVREYGIDFVALLYDNGTSMRMSVNANDLAILKHFYGNEKGKGKKSVKTTNTSLVGTTSSLPKVSAGQGKQLVPGYVLDPYHGLDAYESDYTSSEDEYESDNEPPALYSSSPRKSRSYHRIESSQSSIRSEASTASTSAFTLDTSVDEEDDIETIATDGFLREQAGLPTRADQVKQRRKKEHREFIKCGDEEIYIWHAEGARKTLSPEEKKKRTALQRENDKMMDEFWDLADSAKRRMERKAVKLDNKKGASSAGQSKIKSSAPAKLKRRAIEYK